LVKVM